MKGGGQIEINEIILVFTVVICNCIAFDLLQFVIILSLNIFSVFDELENSKKRRMPQALCYF